MALSSDEKKRILKMLDQLDRSKLERILASIENFGNWLSSVAYSIYCKVKDGLRSIWLAIRNFFS